MKGDLPIRFNWLEICEAWLTLRCACGEQRLHSRAILTREEILESKLPVTTLRQEAMDELERMFEVEYRRPCPTCGEKRFIVEES
jgi:hypothetical protein